MAANTVRRVAGKVSKIVTYVVIICTDVKPKTQYAMIVKRRRQIRERLSGQSAEKKAKVGRKNKATAPGKKTSKYEIVKNKCKNL